MNETSFSFSSILRFYVGEDDFSPSGLTLGERILIWRRREKLTHGKACQYFGLSVTEYGRIERGMEPLPLGAVPWSGPSGLSAGERCLIYRRRAGVLQDDVASDLGCYSTTVSEMERGIKDSQLLLAYWRCRYVSRG